MVALAEVEATGFVGGQDVKGLLLEAEIGGGKWEAMLS